MTASKEPESITLQDVAKAAGVSRTTASNAFNRPDQLSAELRERILAIAHQMGYSGPNPMARMLRTGRAGAIGLVFADSLPYAFSDPTSIAFLQGVSRVCERAKASLLIVPTYDSEAAQETIQQAAVDGFILYCLDENSPAINRVLDRKLPVVIVDLAARNGIASVKVDDRQAARQAAEHLIQLNHRQFAILSLELLPDQYIGAVTPQRIQQATFQNTLDRLFGYQDALSAAGIDFSQIPIEECPGNSEELALERALHLLQQMPRPTAILAMSDRLAIGALHAAEQLGIAVPDELSVIGFDDIPLASQIRPTLTTIQQPLVEKGAIAAQLLLETNPPTTSKLLPTQLIVRESTGIAPAR
jgi:DNA-binding LacI/PurR family transcriptional regulator